MFECVGKEGSQLVGNMVEGESSVREVWRVGAFPRKGIRYDTININTSFLRSEAGFKWVSSSVQHGHSKS